MREDAALKGRRLLVEGRLVVDCINESEIVAHVRGDSAREYVVTYDPSGWHCSCDALGKCSHVIALQLVTLEPHRNRA